MPVIAPQTDVYLLKVPLEINDINQLDFSSKQAQFNYFNSLPKYELTEFTYQRKDGIIRVPLVFDDLLSYNYVMYRNNEFSDKWFYAFIDSLEFKSPNSTDIAIKTDTWQSWMFDITFKPTLIDREHVSDDTIGAHTLPEGLELGEFITNGNVTNFGGVGGVGMSDYCTVVEVSQIENEGESQRMSYSWVTGSHAITPRLNSTSRGTIPLVLGFRNATEPSVITYLYDLAGLSDAIVNVYMLPKSLVGSYNEINITVSNIPSMDGGSITDSNCVIPATSSGVTDLGTTTFTRPTSLAGYTPKNNKLLTFPYCYFNISNNAGTSDVYHYEDFASSSIGFKTEGTFGASGSVKTTPQDYKGISASENGLDFSVTAPKYPICSWKSDSYTNWLTQNAVNMRHQWTSTIIAGLAGTAGGGIGAYSQLKGVEGIGTGALVKGTALGAGSGAAQMAGDLVNVAIQQHLAKTQANMVSDQVQGNLNAGDFLWAKYRSPFTYMPMSVKPEYARCIDEFFSQFGYKCNRVKLPNIRGRRNWNYVKTVGCYIAGDIPQADMQEIKSMFDRGITIWHNPSTFADYSQNNDII